MSTETADYSIQINSDRHLATIAGSLRLNSPNAYESPFSSIVTLIETEGESNPVNIDISGLNFLNSSGVTAIAKLILKAREKNASLVVHCNSDIPWQEKTIPALTKLYQKVSLEYKAPE